jgi:DNA/RNA endonuclease YhcR with UshA esterase domain
MKIIIFILFVFLFTGCAKKQAVVEIKKFEDNKKVNVPDTTVRQDPEKQELQSSGNTEVLNISSKEAASHINQNAVVKGYVADVVIREKVAYLNFDSKFPKNTFTGVIFKKEFNTFGDLGKYKNKTIELSGVITEYNKKPQIILNLPTQIKIIK